MYFSNMGPHLIRITHLSIRWSTTLCMCLLSLAILAQDSVPSSASDNFPSGRIEGPFSWESKIFPGTVRDYWIYLPAQYNADKPACSMIVQDGLGRARGWGLTETLDSLIHVQTLPVIVGIFVDHGKVASVGEDNYPRFNRSFEYDALGDRYARFLLDELLPELEKKYNLSQDPNDRSIAGASSGAICAFNAAWERPDAFHRVLSTIGTYVGLRGGDEFATLVRKTEPKPLRVFMEDGSGDLNIYAGDWWMANQDMFSSLTWAGYPVTHIWGEEGHNSRGAKKIMAEALQWLWADYPEPVTVDMGKYQGLQLALPEEPWREITLPEQNPGRLTTDGTGKLYFTELNSQSLFTLDEEGVPVLRQQFGFRPGGLSFSGTGQLYVADLDHDRLLSYERNGNAKVILSGIRADYLMVSRKGFYFSDIENSRIGFYSYATGQLSYVEIPGKPAGLTLSADQTFLTVSLREKVQAYSFKITEEGHLAFGQAYIHYHIPYGQTTACTTGIAVDDHNRTYSASDMGIQVADQLGRINFIFSKPGKHESDVRFGGKELNLLYLISDGRLFGRKINAKGVISWQDPVKPPRPRM